MQGLSCRCGDLSCLEPGVHQRRVGSQSAPSNPDIFIVNRQNLGSQRVGDSEGVRDELQVVLDDQPGAPGTADGDRLLSQQLQATGRRRATDLLGVQILHYEGCPIYLGPISHSRQTSQSCR